MKTHCRCLIPLLSLAVLLPVGLAAEKNDSPPPAKTERSGTTRVYFDRAAKDLPKVPVTFLGVETMPASPTLVAQLGLADGTGLVVTNVVPDSPATSVLKEHDILVKLDDQLLIEVRQLAVLVRNHKEGDEIALTYIRGGKQQTATVKLVTREMPKLSFQFPGAGAHVGAVVGNIVPSGLERSSGELARRPVESARIQTESLADQARMMSMLQSTPPQSSVRIIESEGSPAARRVTMLHPSTSRIISSDEAGELELKIDNGQKELTANDTKGAVIFSGPINTPEERQALPESVRPRLEKLLQMQGVSFTPDGDFRASAPVAPPLPGRQI
jgi:serine protease Do